MDTFKGGQKTSLKVPLFNAKTEPLTEDTILSEGMGI